MCVCERVFTIRRSANDVSSNIECEVIRTNCNDVVEAATKAGLSWCSVARLVPETILNVALLNSLNDV